MKTYEIGQEMLTIQQDHAHINNLKFNEQAINVKCWYHSRL